jgi:hypothetical protein
LARAHWVYVGGRAENKPPQAEKVAIDGKWHDNTYRFVTRFRSDDPRSYEPEFGAPFASLEYVSRDCFDLSWHRHTGEWFCLFQRQSLAEALHLIESERHFEPC